MKRLEHPPTEEKLRDLELFSLEKSSLRDLISVDKYLKGKCQEEGASIFSLVPCNRMRVNGHKVEQRKLGLNTRKNFLSMRMLNPWTRLQRSCGFSLSTDFQNPPGHIPVWLALSSPAPAEELH